jgi:hypothetical protein
VSERRPYLRPHSPRAAAHCSCARTEAEAFTYAQDETASEDGTNEDVVTEDSYSIIFRSVCVTSRAMIACGRRKLAALLAPQAAAAAPAAAVLLCTGTLLLAVNSCRTPVAAAFANRYTFAQTGVLWCVYGGS